MGKQFALTGNTDQHQQQHQQQQRQPSPPQPQQRQQQQQQQQQPLPIPTPQHQRESEPQQHGIEFAPPVGTAGCYQVGLAGRHIGAKSAATGPNPPLKLVHFYDQSSAVTGPTFFATGSPSGHGNRGGQQQALVSSQSSPRQRTGSATGADQNSALLLPPPPRLAGDSNNAGKRGSSTGTDFRAAVARGSPRGGSVTNTSASGAMLKAALDRRPNGLPLHPAQDPQTVVSGGDQAFQSAQATPSGAHSVSTAAVQSGALSSPVNARVVPSARKAWYLDAPENEASAALLDELGIVSHRVHLGTGSEDVNVQLWKLAQSRLLMNSKSGGDVVDRGAIQIGDLPATAFMHDDMEDQGGEARFDSLEGLYCVWGGEAFVDVRDWADCWVRIRLLPGDVVLIPPNKFHRATPKSPGARLVQVRVKTCDGSVNVDIRDPRAAPPPGSSGTMPGDPRDLVASLCRQFYHLGWVTGTGGSISIRHGNRIFMTPSGVQKERLRASDLFVLDRQGTILKHPWSQNGGTRLKLSACATLFQHAYRMRGAGAVLHSHGINCVLAAMICERKRVTEFRITHQEMIKGMMGHGYHDELVIPVIDNTAREEDLADSLANAITRYPKANAVLVQRHGCYVWGPTWEKAKTQSECLHYLFEAAVRMEQAGFDPMAPPIAGCRECGAGIEVPSDFARSGEITSGRNGVLPARGSSGHCQPFIVSAASGATTNEHAQGCGKDKGSGSEEGTSADSSPSRSRLTSNSSSTSAYSKHQKPHGQHRDGSGSCSGDSNCSASGGGVIGTGCAIWSSEGRQGNVRANKSSDEESVTKKHKKDTQGGSQEDVVRGSSAETPPFVSLDGVKVILLDIEGTTTPLTFVHDKLFPYARNNLDQHIQEKWKQDELQQLVEQLRAQSVLDAESTGTGDVPQVLRESEVGVELAQASVADYVRYLMAADRKLGPMKALQGHIWRDGYRSGWLTAEVFPDVLPALRCWTESGKKVAIYSSGSREAQGLLFGHTAVGDLRSYISAYFDTSIGSKREETSYKEIALSLGVDKPSDMLFVTDLAPEAEAANRADVRTVLSSRPGNGSLPQEHSFPVVTDFTSIR